MPSHAHCVAFGCANKKNKCKRKLVPLKDGKTYVPVRACGMDDPGCCNMSKECKSIRFHWLPSDPLKRARWLQAVKRENVPMTRNSYICSVSFDAESGFSKERQAPKGDPSIFVCVSKPPKPQRQTRTSLRARSEHPRERPDHVLVENRIAGVRYHLQYFLLDRP